MTDKQVCRYTELANRKSFIIMHSGASWKPEYAEELEAIDQELAELRQVIDQEHEERSEEMSNQYLNAAQVAEIMDCSERHGYKVIQGLNQELKSKGFITRSGRIPRKYFFQRTGLEEIS